MVVLYYKYMAHASATTATILTAVQVCYKMTQWYIVTAENHKHIYLYTTIIKLENIANYPSIHVHIIIISNGFT